MMAAPAGVAICLFWLSAIIGPSAPLGAEAASLRARALDRSDATVATSGGASPADVEEEEDEELEPLDQSSPPAFGSAQPAALQVEAVAKPDAPPRRQQVVVTAPQQVAVAATQAAPAVLAAGIGDEADEEALFQLPAALPHAAPPRPPAVPAVTGGGHAKLDFRLARTNVSLEDPAVAVWPPATNSFMTCDPPCIEGRGLCNDNVCFCRSPFTGSTCQHKMTDLYRAPVPMVAGFAVVCFVMGIVLSKIIFTFSEHAVETRLQRYGPGKKKCESWTPPQQDHDGHGVTPRMN